MTDIATVAQTALKHFKLPRLAFPMLAMGASFGAMFRLIGDAFGMAYVVPYANLGGRRRIVPDEELQGRDPEW